MPVRAFCRSVRRTAAMVRCFGQCLCGGVRLAVHGTPKRAGICHSTDSRKEIGPAVTYGAVRPGIRACITG
uniref:GFA family protein n=1 Tax=Tistrella mobilis TaxID=171437 RepID=UPI003FD23699